ncbi:MAG: DUF2184 domain-containing protein [Campylobacteraceae bacterium]|jgi:hypothetical protein|nr:DUF2184 domain-containing protein [Campylobacteraceae bacterium]
MSKPTYANLYNLDSFKTLQNEIKTKGNFKDALPNGLIMGRSLEYIDPKIFEQQYPDLTFEQTGVCIDNSGGYATSITKRKRGISGEFREVNDDASNKGKISLIGEKGSLLVHSYEAHSNWTRTEVAQASVENRDIVGEFISAHNEIYRRDIDTIFYIGKGTITEGISNYSGFATDTASGYISTLTGQQAYRTIANFIEAQWTAAVNVKSYMANIVILPVEVNNYLAKTPYGVNENPDTVLTVLKKNFPEIKFITTYQANKTGNVTAISNSDNALSFRIPLPLEFSDIFIHGFKGEFDTAYRIAGIDVSENIAGRHLAGLIA